MQQSFLIYSEAGEAADAMASALRAGGAEVRIARDSKECMDCCRSASPDLVLVDIDAKDGPDTIGALIERDAGCVIVAVARRGDGTRVADAIRRGAADFVAHDVDIKELEIVLRRAIDGTKVRRELDQQRRQPTRRSVGIADVNLIGQCPEITKVREAIERIAGVDGDQPAPVLVLGETGTGKDLIARLVHTRSARRDRPFIDVNCTALPENLVEAELFGFEAGSFTDARSAKPGLFEAADSGTLFLDEIGDLALPAQAKLLKVLEQKEVRRVGSVKGRKVNVQIVAATNRDLRKAVAEGTFRSDLYYRLNVFKVRLPPLRERGDDIVLLAEHFVQVHAVRYGKRDLQISPSYRKALISYNWPGNVRELSNVVERSVIIAKSGQILEIPGFESEQSGVRIEFATGGAIKNLSLPPQGIDLEEVEKQLLRKALEAEDGNIAGAARRLGITRERMRYRMEKYGLGS